MTVPNLKKAIRPRVVFIVLAMTLVLTILADSQMPQYPMMEMVANKVIAKYQNMSCADLQKSKSTPPSGQEA